MNKFKKLTFFGLFLEKSERAGDWNDDTKCVENEQCLDRIIDQLSCFVWLFSGETVKYFKHFEAKI